MYLVENGICRKVPVATGTYSGGMVKITEGPETEAQVIVNPDSHSLKDGMKVEVR